MTQIKFRPYIDLRRKYFRVSFKLLHFPKNKLTTEHKHGIKQIVFNMKLFKNGIFSF